MSIPYPLEHRWNDVIFKKIKHFDNIFHCNVNSITGMLLGTVVLLATAFFQVSDKAMSLYAT